MALRIPKPLADEAGIVEGSPVELTLREGKLIIGPLSAPEPDLELLAAVTEKNLHREVDAGPEP